MINHIYRSVFFLSILFASLAFDVAAAHEPSTVIDVVPDGCVPPSDDSADYLGDAFENDFDDLERHGLYFKDSAVTTAVCKSNGETILHFYVVRDHGRERLSFVAVNYLIDFSSKKILRAGVDYRRECAYSEIIHEKYLDVFCDCFSDNIPKIYSNEMENGVVMQCFEFLLNDHKYGMDAK